MKKKNDYSILPPFTRALLQEAAKKREDFDTPGHHSGAFYRLSKEGRLFTEALGKGPFRADISDSSDAIGDPSSHEGVSGAAERLAASVWGSDACFFVLGGTSTSNRIAANALLAEGDAVLFDRNNHKSTWQGALIQAGAIPVYLSSGRNDAGVIGPLTEESLSEEAIRKSLAQACPKALARKRPFRLACLQLVTYDGLFLNAEYILSKLGHLCDYILFDDAWGGYENFIPLLKKSAVLAFSLGEDAPGILVTQSVHKQLSGFSMTSQIHKKDRHLAKDSRYVPDDVFQDTFLMHISTSPYYPLFAGLEMNAFLHSQRGPGLWEKAFRRSVDLRKKLLKETTLFRPFLPPFVHGRRWEEGRTSDIMKDSAYFALDPKEQWHGFQGFDGDAFLLDPCKVLITTGTFSDERADSLPSPLVSLYLQEQGITPEKSDFYTLLFLAEPGDSEKKMNHLVKALRTFEKAWQDNRKMKDFLPSVPSLPEEGLRDFCSRFHSFLAAHDAGNLLASLFRREGFPRAPLSGHEAHQHFLRGDRTAIPLEKAEGRIALENLMPYPPGICALAAGEMWTENVLSYFLFLEDYGKEFPAFSPEILGVHHDEKGQPYVWILAD